MTPTDLSSPTLSVADLVAEIVDTTNLSIIAGSEKAVYLIGGVEFDVDAKSIGKFTDGLTTAGTLLIQNQNPANPPAPATYSGGLGFDAGIVLCTGRIEEVGGADGEGDGIGGAN